MCNTLTLPTHRLCRCVRGGLPPQCVSVPHQWTGSAVREGERVFSVFFLDLQDLGTMYCILLPLGPTGVPCPVRTNSLPNFLQ
jgi:hypothetical protein